MIGCIIHRMIFWELVKVFLLCLIAITGMLLIAGIVAEASQQGLPPGKIIQVIPLLIPSTLPYTIPATTLFATCVVYGRLAADNEILAIRASGINIVTVVAPGLVLGAIMSVVTMGLYYRTIPHTHHVLRSMFLSDVEELLYNILKRQHQIAANNLDYSIFVKGVQGRQLVNAIFKHRDNKGDMDVVAQARQAELRVDMPHKNIIVHMRDGVAWSKGAQAYFEDRYWEVPMPDSLIAQHLRRPREMLWEELFDERVECVQERESLEKELEKAENRLNTPGAPEDLPMHLGNLKNKIKGTTSSIRALDAEVQMRPALAIGCFCFILIGCPVGIWFGRSDYLSSFISCFLPIVIVYYPMLLCGTAMAKDGRFSPAVSIWAADALAALVGAMLFRKLLKN